ncbi:hypothetical protein [Pontixanthobacter sp.]|uniref:hypothetical protein n=1 Tax=Pontixanthobacter sp. TaxID=2792078 RepID=UPI003C7C45E2
MKKHALWTIPLAAAALMAAPAIGQDTDGAAGQGMQTEGEIKLAKMLEGRVAVKASSCIPLRPAANLTVIDGTALVYRQGRTLYVNVPQNPRSLDDDDALVTRLFSSRLCRSDIVTTVDRFSGFYTGNIFLGEFIAYRPAEQAS